MKIRKEFIKKVSKKLGNLREIEYTKTKPWLASSKKILDVACGTGTFLQLFPNNSQGIDINPNNVNICISKGLKAQVASALNLPYPDATFDAVHCSHLMQVFLPADAAQMMREICRVLQPGGIAIISTLNWFPRFFRHPENVRPYPPDTFWRLYAIPDGESSPMFENMKPMTKAFLWLRRPALFEFYSSTNKDVAGMSELLNMAQYKIGLRKYWRYNSYIIGLIKN